MWVGLHNIACGASLGVHPYREHAPCYMEDYNIYIYIYINIYIYIYIYIIYIYITVQIAMLRARVTSFHCEVLAQV